MAPLPGADVHPPGPLQVVEARRGGRARQVDLGAGEGRTADRLDQLAGPLAQDAEEADDLAVQVVVDLARAPGACAAGPRRRPRRAPRSRRAAAGGPRSRARGGLSRRNSGARPGSDALPDPRRQRPRLAPAHRPRGPQSESRSSSRRPPRLPALVLPAGGAAQPVLAGQVGGAPPAALRAVGGAGPRDLVQAADAAPEAAGLVGRLAPERRSPAARRSPGARRGGPDHGRPPRCGAAARGSRTGGAGRRRRSLGQEGPEVDGRERVEGLHLRPAELPARRARRAGRPAASRRRPPARRRASCHAAATARSSSRTAARWGASHALRTARHSGAGTAPATIRSAPPGARPAPRPGSGRRAGRRTRRGGRRPRAPPPPGPGAPTTTPRPAGWRPGRAGGRGGRAGGPRPRRPPEAQQLEERRPCGRGCAARWAPTAGWRATTRSVAPPGRRRCQREPCRPERAAAAAAGTGGAIRSPPRRPGRGRRARRRWRRGVDAARERTGGSE